MAEAGLNARQHELQATNIAMILLAVLFVGLRFLSRHMKGLGVGADDVMILVALFFLFVASTVCMIGIKFGLGRHTTELDTPTIISYAKSLVAFECVYVTCVCVTKVSLLLMYRRIFPVRSIHIGSLILAVLSIGWCISIIMVSVFQCIPMEKIWNPTLAGYCINLKASFIGNAIPNILTDMAILALPMHQVWSLHTSVLQKTQISVVFLLGSFVIFTSIYRFITIFRFQPADVTFTLATAEVWCVVESASGIVSACLPTIGHLVQVCSRKLGISSGLTWSSRARTPSIGNQLQTIGGTGGIRKSNNDDKNESTTSSRAFRRLSAFSALSEERKWEARDAKNGGVGGGNGNGNDLESGGSTRSLGSDEIPLHGKNSKNMIVVQTDLQWEESREESA